MKKVFNNNLKVNHFLQNQNQAIFLPQFDKYINTLNIMSLMTRESSEIIKTNFIEERNSLKDEESRRKAE